MYDVLIIGAGLSGCVMANLCAENGKRVLIIDRKSHIGGKFYDYIDENGILVQKYGFRIIETSDSNVISFLENHGTWIRTTDNTKMLSEDVYYDHRIEGVPSRDSSISECFKDARTRKYFSKYYLEADVNDVQCSDYDKTRCVPKKPLSFQAVPLKGYTEFFKKILDNEKITVKLDTDYFDPDFQTKATQTFYCGRIDEYYATKGIPSLVYMTTYFEFETANENKVQKYPVIDYPDPDTLFVRSVEYKYILGNSSVTDVSVVSREYNTFFKQNDEICIPLKTARNRALYNKYLRLKEKENKIHLLGSTANFDRYCPDTSIIKTFELFDSVSLGQEMTKTKAMQIVNEAYLKILKRPADDGGLETYTAFLLERTEKQGKEELECILYDSDEYLDKLEMLKELEGQLSNPIDPPQLEGMSKQKYDVVDIRNEDITKWVYKNYHTIQKNHLFRHAKYNPETLPEDLFSYTHYFGDYFRTREWTYVSKKKLLEKSRKYYKTNDTVDFTMGLQNVPHLIVSRYSEDITWTDLFDNVTIYNKGKPNLETKHKIINIENVGREGETYIHYIIDNYDNLHDYIIFCQGFPFEHSPRFIDSMLHQYKGYSDYQSLTWRWKDSDDSISWLSCKNKTGIPPMECRQLTKCFYLDDCPIHYELLDKNFKCIYPLSWTDGGINECLIPRVIEREKLGESQTVLDYIYKRLNLGDKTPHCIPFNYSANFGVSKQKILRHSKTFYKNVRDFLLEHPDNGYLVERLWMHFFTGF
jgi:UDP-galactopyranose mutase